LFIIRRRTAGQDNVNALVDGQLLECSKEIEEANKGVVIKTTPLQEILLSWLHVCVSLSAQCLDYAVLAQATSRFDQSSALGMGEVYVCQIAFRAFKSRALPQRISRQSSIAAQ